MSNVKSFTFFKKTFQVNPAAFRALLQYIYTGITFFSSLFVRPSNYTRRIHNLNETATSAGL